MGDQEATTPRPNYAATNGVPSTLYRNNGDGTFTDVTRHARVGSTGWGMAAAWADYDGDGWPDLYVANEFGQNALYHNERDGTFTDVSDAAGVRDTQWGWSAEFLDYDNDGRLDLYAVNGFISGPILDDV